VTKDVVVARLDYFKLVHGVTVRAIAAFADEDLAFRPKPGMRSPRELIYHVYRQEKSLAESARDGRMTPDAAALSNPEEGAGASACRALTTVAEAVAFAQACHQAADAAFRAIPADEFARPIESPFGTYPAWQYFTFAYDEHWHHRGQLYTYLRLLGKEPPMLYDYQ
jgi:uncharacterized damage-inducible protein DinB